MGTHCHSIYIQYSAYTEMRKISCKGNPVKFSTYSAVHYSGNDCSEIHYSTILQYNTLQYNTLQYNTLQYNPLQYNTLQCNTLQYNTLQYNTLHYNTIQYNTIQYNTIPHVLCVDT